MTTENDVAGTSPWDVLRRLDRDLRQAARLLGRKQARYLVDAYYQIQDYRIAAAAQVRSSSEDAEPHRLIGWLFDNMRFLEEDIKRALDAFGDEYKVGLWLKSVTGIGPVISAGLLAHLEVERCPTAGHFWRFAGLDPSCVWEKGHKRPWNAELKVLSAFKAGESFVKFQNHQGDHYGKFFRQRKDLEISRNEAGAFRAQAEAVLAAKKIGKATEAYKWYAAGKLPPAHVHARARRWAVKLFLSHLHHVMYVDWFGAEPPAPYAFTQAPQADHRHYVPPPFPLPEAGKSLRQMGA